MLTRVEGGLTLHTHFRMDGSWHLQRPGARWRGGPAHQVRAILANAEWEAVGYRLHDVRLLPTAEEDTAGRPPRPGRARPGLGPGRGRPPDHRGPGPGDRRRAAGPAGLAGVGNLYKGETLFLTGLSPWTPVGQVPDVPKVVATAYRLMRANRDHPEQSTTGSLRRDETHWVYGRAGRPCRRCGTRIQLGEQGPAEYARVTYWCPRCQPGPGGG